MQWVIIKRTRRAVAKTFMYSEVYLNPDGLFNNLSVDAAVFPSMEQAEFVANGFQLEPDVEYEVRPFAPPEISMEQAEFVANGFQLEPDVEYEVRPFTPPEID